MPPYVVAPLVSASLYAFAAMMLKRATANGGGPWRISFVTNWVQAICFAPFWLLGGAPFTWSHLAHAILTGAVFFIGQVLTFLALSQGDVSVTTPVLGTKVVFVALLTVVIMRQGLSPALWGASLLTVAATALLGGGKPTGDRAVFLRSLVYGFSAAAAFALTDIMAQKWARDWGFAHFAPTMFFTVALCSFLLVPRFREPLWEMPPRTWRWLLPGALVLSAQACGIAYSIMTFGEATLVNIVYATRGLWTVLTVWAVGHWFENTEREHGTPVMLRRLGGSMLLIGAVYLAIG